MPTVSVSLQYAWEPFLVNGTQLYFNQLARGQVRVQQGSCSHSGAAIYKWSGRIDDGEHAGKTGILIGETNDLRARLSQYKSGTQITGNRFWREQFLTKGSIYYWVLRLGAVRIDGRTAAVFDLSSKNNRLIVEQLLVQKQLAESDRATTWVVNRMQ